MAEKRIKFRRLPSGSAAVSVDAEDGEYVDAASHEAIKVQLVKAEEINIKVRRELHEAERLLRALLTTLNVAFDRCDGDLLGVHHNKGTDTMNEAEGFLRDSASAGGGQK